MLIRVSKHRKVLQRAEEKCAVHIHGRGDRVTLQAGDAVGLNSCRGRQCSTAPVQLQGCRAHWVSAAGLAQCLPVRRDAGPPGPSGLRDHLDLHLPLLCDSVVLRLLSTQTAVGKLRTQILQSTLPQNLNFPCGCVGRDRCLAGRFSFKLLDQTKVSNLQEFKCSNRNILALPSLNTCIINISWKN